MQQPLVLKRHLRWEKWEIGLSVLWLGFVIWYLTQNIFGGITSLITVALIKARQFLRRTIFSNDKIVIWGDGISNRVVHFDRIISYLIFEDWDDKTKARLWLEHTGEEREISISIKPEQTELLLGFLRHQGAVSNEAAAKEWERHKIGLELAKNFQRAKRSKPPLSEEQLQALLADAEAKLQELEN